MSGVRSGVNGTPTFFINGVRHDDTFDFDTLLQALERAMERRRAVTEAVTRTSAEAPVVAPGE